MLFQLSYDRVEDVNPITPARTGDPGISHSLFINCLLYRYAYIFQPI
jgi:hypothetical protein